MSRADRRKKRAKKQADELRKALREAKIEGWAGALEAMAKRPKGITTDEIVDLVEADDDGIDIEFEPEPGTDAAVATVALTVPAKPGRGAYLRRELRLLWHDARRIWHHRNPIKQFLYVSAWCAFPAWSLIRVGVVWWQTALGIGGLVAVRGWRIWKDYDPKHMQLIQIHYDERKAGLQKLLHAAQLWYSAPPTPRECADFQRDVLQLIAMYMRDHRSDVRGKKIFANLLLRDRDGVSVIRRSDTNRPVPQHYTAEQCSVVWAALETRSAQCTGDLLSEHPSTGTPKTYNSVLAIPIILGDQVLGAVSIDSEAKYHFDRHREDLPNHLAPYVQLMAVALLFNHDTQVLASNPRRAG